VTQLQPTVTRAEPQYHCEDCGDGVARTYQFIMNHYVAKHGLTYRQAEMQLRNEVYLLERRTAINALNGVHRI
jgi:hypothetical protein